LTAKGTILQRN